LLRQPRLDVPLSSSLIFYTQQLAFQIFSANPHPVFGATENARLENPAPSKIQGWKTRNWKTRHQIAGVENEGINCMDSQ